MAVQSIEDGIRHLIHGRLASTDLPADLDVLPRRVACELAGVQHEAFRYWVKIGLIEDKKAFSLRDAKKIRAIKELVDAGFKPSGLVGRI